MTQKSQPIGLRITISTLWIHWYDTLFTKYVYDSQFFFRRWLTGFFEKNFLLLATIQFLQQWRFLQCVSIVFFAWGSSKDEQRISKTFFQKKIINMRFKQQARAFAAFFLRQYVQLQHLFLSWRTRYFRWPCLQKYTGSKKWIPAFCYPFRGIKEHPEKKSRNLEQQKTNFKATSEQMLHRFYLLRLKTVLEFALAIFGRKKIVLFLTNLHGSTPFKTNFDPLTNFHQEVLTVSPNRGGFRFTSRLFCEIILYTVLCRTPTLLLQYFYYQLSFVGKHTLQTSHIRFIITLTRALELLLYTFTGLRGFLITICGKYDGNTRTRSRSYNAGESYSPQRLGACLTYGIRHMPLYGGILSFRFWLMYYND